MTTSYAESESQARERYAQYSSVDPFPDIPPALLNSADIADYVRVTGMLFPFDPSEEKLKTASYEIDFVGDVYRWDKPSGEPDKITVGPGGVDKLKLPRNSIYFFSPRTLFQIPNYIALRFNLRIQHVHRGLLLGTGPLIDPGFQGPLLIPLHNLTSIDYTLEAGKGIIWVEFTKLSPEPSEEQRSGNANQLPRLGRITHFPLQKSFRTPVQYLAKAAPHDAIQSSVLDIEQRVNRAERRLARFKTIGWISGLSVLIAMVGILYSVVSVVQDANKYVREAEKSAVDVTEAKLKGLEARIGKVEEAERAREQLQQKARVAEKTSPKKP